MSEVTNDSIFSAVMQLTKTVGAQGQQLDSLAMEVSQVHEQTKRTNGRVNALEQKNEVAEKVAVWQEKNNLSAAPVAILPAPKNYNIDFTKIIIAFVAFATAFVTALATIASFKH